MTGTRSSVADTEKQKKQTNNAKGTSFKTKSWRTGNRTGKGKRNEIGEKKKW